MKHNNKPKKHQRQVVPTEFDLQQYSTHDLYSKAEEEYKKLSSTQQNKWEGIIRRAGTKKDRINILATEILKNPHTSLQQFQELLHQCFDNNHHHALSASQSLTNIYHEYVFLNSDNLKTFWDSLKELTKQKKKKVTISLTDLVGFYLEHHIKHFYAQLVRGIELLLGSTISFIKKAAITMLTSLTKHGELRRMVIGTLINKFGDTDMEIVNQVYKSLKEGFYQDINSSSVLLEESRTFLFRENCPRKAQFYVINFLNNLNMSILNQKGLGTLFELFYHFFQKMMGEDNKEGSVSSRLFLNSIKGLNKIFGFVKGGGKNIREMIMTKIESIYKIVHTTTNTKAKVQLYLFLFQYYSHLHGSISDRFYRSLYEFLNNPEILHCSLAQVFFDLLLISLQQDTNINRVLAFMKRVLQLCFTAQPNFITTTLIMLNKLIQQKDALKLLIQQKEGFMKEEDETVKQYDSSKRQPIFAGAENTLIWELTVFSNHFHPTVRKYAQCLINGEEVIFDGSNPLVELSTTSFLEKLVLKKERKSEAWKLKMKRNLNKIRTSKYETLIDKGKNDFTEDQTYIQKYLSQRSAIHNNFRKKQTTDIEQFADQIIEKQMDRLNPKDEEADLSMSQQIQDQSQNAENSWDQEGEELEDENDQEIEEDDNDEEAFESEEDSNNEFQEEQEQDGEEMDSMEEGEESEQNSKQWQDAFNEIGDDRFEDEPRKGKSRKNNLRGKIRNNQRFKRKVIRK